MFIQLTSVSVPHDLKFSTVPRTKSDPKSISYHSLGEKFPQNRIIFDRSEKKSESVQCMRKSGVLTFMVNKPVMLYGVNIIVDKVRSSRISLSVFRKDETIKQISSKSFVIKPSRSEECLTDRFLWPRILATQLKQIWMQQEDKLCLFGRPHFWNLYRNLGFVRRQIQYSVVVLDVIPKAYQWMLATRER